MRSMRVKCFKNIVLVILLSNVLSAIAQEREVVVNIRGVYDAKITVRPHNGIRFEKPLIVIPDVKWGEQAVLHIPDSLLPGEFLFRFSYRTNQEDHPYPGETQLFLNKEDIEMDINPRYLHGDSLILKNDRENRLWFYFMNQTSQKRVQMDLLTQLLQGYTGTKEEVYTNAIESYQRRRTDFNLWVDSIYQQNKDLYVSRLFSFSKIHRIDWDAAPEERILQQTRDFFNFINLEDTLVLRSRHMNQFMGAYMGLFGQLSTTEALRDSLFTLAGSMACRKAQQGHPLVYGWFVDYFFNGYEKYNITQGLQMLSEHINNPDCLTTKRREIMRRLKGIESLVKGVKAPLLKVQDIENSDITIDWNAGGKDYQLVVFYESECGHCGDLITGLKKWNQNPVNSDWINIITIGLDDKREDWIKASKDKNFPWKDYHARGGVNSEAAAAYYVLSTPNMFLVDRSGVLQALPTSIKELNLFLHGE